MHHLKGFCGTVPAMLDLRSGSSVRARKKWLLEGSKCQSAGPHRHQQGCQLCGQISAQIWEQESPRIDMVIVPFDEIETMLQRVANLPFIQGTNADNVSRDQIQDYVQALNSIGFYNWSMKWHLDRVGTIPPENPGSDVVVAVPPIAMSYTDICVLYKHIGLLKGDKFTWRTLERRSESEIGRFRTIVYPVSHGSFHTGKECFEAFMMKHSGCRASDIASLHVIVPSPLVFGAAAKYPFPQEHPSPVLFSPAPIQRV